MAVRFNDARQQFLLCIVTRAVTDHALFVAELFIKEEGVFPFERGF